MHDIAKKTDAPPIYVTKSSLPPLEDVVAQLATIWDNGILTNRGPMHQLFEVELAKYLDVPAVALTANGTLALISMLRALNLSGEIITVPYSFVATTHAIKFCGLEPVFVDIEPGTMNIDPSKIEAAITSKTSAILAVHCYGTPCDTVALADISTRYGIPVLYDAAHAFGVQKDGSTILTQGAMSSLSFHATKVFNTFEGGAIICPDTDTASQIRLLQNFGISDETHVDTIGYNAKMNEFQAIVGLEQLKHVGGYIAQRTRIAEVYTTEISQIDGLEPLPCPADVLSNHSYYPIRVTAQYPESRDALYHRLKQVEIHTRRYFYPLISSLPMYSALPSAHPSNLPVATQAAEEILCLPIYPGLSDSDLGRIISHLKTIVR